MFFYFFSARVSLAVHRSVLSTLLLLLLLLLSLALLATRHDNDGHWLSGTSAGHVSWLVDVAEQGVVRTTSTS